jgi:hypothetical protein
MLLDAPYMARPRLAAARQLQRAGQWDLAVDLLAAEPPDPTTAALRADILVDRHWWRLDRAAEAQQAVTELAEDHSSSALAAFLDAQLRYTRALFGTQFGLHPDPDDTSLAEQAFRQAVAAEPLRGWATFWLGVLADNLHHDQASAADRYAQALQLADGDDDQLLISCVVRHQGFHLLGSDHQQAVARLRRSLYLRAALGARPQVAAAQATLADALPAGTERDVLRDTATRLAGDLGLSWLLAMLRGDPT